MMECENSLYDHDHNTTLNNCRADAQMVKTRDPLGKK